MPEAIRLRGLTVGSMVASLKGRDIAEVYVVMDVQDPYVLCFNGQSRFWPERPKKKRIKHVLKIGESSRLSNMTPGPPEDVNRIIRELIAERKEMHV